MTDATIAVAAPRSLRRAVSRWERFDVPRRVTLVAAVAVVVLVGLLLGFIGWNGIQVFTDAHIPLSELLGSIWAPGDAGDQTSFGLLPFILGTLGVMAVAAVIAAPLSDRPRALHGRGRAALGALDHPAGDGGLRRHPERRLRLARDHDPRAVPAQNLSGLGFTLGLQLVRGLARPGADDPADDHEHRLRRVPGRSRRTCASASLALGTTRWQTIRHILLPAAAHRPR